MILPQPPDHQATVARNKKGLTMSGLSCRLVAVIGLCRNLGASLGGKSGQVKR
jgi:hypothetical protein